MKDKYDLAIEKLMEMDDADFRDIVSAAWYADRATPDDQIGCLFQYCTPSGVEENRPDGHSCGCLVQIHRMRHIPQEYKKYHAWTAELTEAIEKDERIPGIVSRITKKNIQVFAEYQRRMDVEIRGRGGKMQEEKTEEREISLSTEERKINFREFL